MLLRVRLGQPCLTVTHPSLEGVCPAAEEVVKGAGVDPVAARKAAVERIALNVSRKKSPCVALISPCAPPEFTLCGPEFTPPPVDDPNGHRPHSTPV
eukprot:7022700-Pyramimonas_sp.AAC.1